MQRHSPLMGGGGRQRSGLSPLEWDPFPASEVLPQLHSEDRCRQMGPRSSNGSHHYLACVLFTTLGETDLPNFASLSRCRAAAAHRTRSAIGVSEIVHRPTPYSVCALLGAEAGARDAMLFSLPEPSFADSRGDMRAWVAAMIEWAHGINARKISAHPPPGGEESGGPVHDAGAKTPRCRCQNTARN